MRIQRDEKEFGITTDKESRKAMIDNCMASKVNRSKINKLGLEILRQ